VTGQSGVPTLGKMFVLRMISNLDRKVKKGGRRKGVYPQGLEKKGRKDPPLFKV